MSFPGNHYSGSLIAICGVYEYSQQIIRAEGDLTDPQQACDCSSVCIKARQPRFPPASPAVLSSPITHQVGFPQFALPIHLLPSAPSWQFTVCWCQCPGRLRAVGVMSDSSHSWAFTSVTPDFLDIIVSCDYATYLCNPSLLHILGPLRRLSVNTRNTIRHVL